MHRATCSVLCMQEVSGSIRTTSSYNVQYNVDISTGYMGITVMRRQLKPDDYYVIPPP